MEKVWVEIDVDYLVDDDQGGYWEMTTIRLDEEELRKLKQAMEEVDYE